MGRHSEWDCIVETLNSFHEVIRTELKTADIEVEQFQYCPHMPDAGCACRKPNPGMISEAVADYDIDLKESWTVGDKVLDVGLGFEAGTKTALVRTGYGANDEKNLKRKPDIIADNILEVARYIVS